MAAGGAEEHFAKKLANNEKRIRDKAVNKLRAWIRSRPKEGPGFDELDLLKIWKGLFYCMWMSDKPLIQEELASNISQLVLSFRNEQSAVLFIKTFFKTIQREWHGIDRLRLDKFYLVAQALDKNFREELDLFLAACGGCCMTMLIRFFVKETFNFLKKNGWEDRLVAEVKHLFQEEPLNPSSHAVPDGIRLHLVSVYLPELGSVANDQVNCDTLLQLLDPLLLLAAHSKNKMVTNAVKKCFFEHLVQNALEDSDEIQNTVIAKIDFAVVADRLFTLASDRNILGRNRNQLFQWVKRLRNHSKEKHGDGCSLQQEEHVNGISKSTESAHSIANEDVSEKENQSSERKTKRKNRKQSNMNSEQENSLCGDHELPGELSKRKRKLKEPDEFGDGALCLGNKGGETEPKKKKKKSKLESSKTDKTPTSKKQGKLDNQDDAEESNLVNKHHGSEEEILTSETVQQPHKSCRDKSIKKHSTAVNGNGLGSPEKASFTSNTVEKKVLQKAASDISEPFAQFKKSSTPPAFVRKCLPKTPKSEPQRRKANEVQSVQDQTPVPVQDEGIYKRVRIEVSKNTAHTTQDYQRSLKESPKIPFDANKTPVQGLLKSMPSQAVLKSPPKPRRTPLPLNKSASSSNTGQRSPKLSKTNKRPRAVDFF